MDERPQGVKMDRFKHILSICLITLVMVLSFRGCKHHQDTVTEQAMTPVLKDGEREKITVDLKAGRVEQTTRATPAGGSKASPGAQVVSHLDGTRKLAITVEKDGTIKVWAQRSGFTFDPGIGIVQEEKPRLSLDAQFWYWRRYGLNAGISCSKAGSLRFFAAGSYNLYRNTSVLIGLDNRKDPLIGLRIAF